MLWLWGCGALIRGVLDADVPGSLSLTLAFRGVEDRGVGGPTLSRLNHRVPRRSGRAASMWLEGETKSWGGGGQRRAWRLPAEAGRSRAHGEERERPGRGVLGQGCDPHASAGGPPHEVRAKTPVYSSVANMPSGGRQPQC